MPDKKGYEEPNYTQVPNAFLDDHLPDMGLAELKVVCFAIRKTFGWQKGSDRISLSQFVEGTGLSKRAVIDGIKQALERGVLQRQKEGQGYRYSVNVACGGDKERGEDTSPADDKVVKQLHRGSEATSQVGSEAASHTKEKTKETIQKSAPAREDDNTSTTADATATDQPATKGSDTATDKDRIRRLSAIADGDTAPAVVKRHAERTRSCWRKGLYKLAFPKCEPHWHSLERWQAYVDDPRTWAQVMLMWVTQDYSPSSGKRMEDAYREAMGRATASDSGPGEGARKASDGA